MSRLKRGVSEIISSLVVLLIVSILGTSIYSFSLTVMQRQKNSLEATMMVEGNKARERIKLLSVEWSGTNDVLNISLLNFGKTMLKIVDIYVNGVRVSTYYYGQHEPILIREVERISFLSPISLSQDNLYQLVLVSERGVSYVQSWES